MVRQYVNAPFSYDFVYQYFKTYGCELLTPKEKYKNVKSRVRFKCACGNKNGSIIFFKFRTSSYKRCEKCIAKIKSDKLKYPYAEVEKIFRGNGCKLLSQTYENRSSPLKFICSCGREDKKSLSRFKEKPCCRWCSYEEFGESCSYSIDEVKNTLVELGCELIETYQRNKKRQVVYICPNGHLADSDYYSVKLNNGRCKDCRKERKGEDHPNWRGGKRAEAQRFRGSHEFKQWRTLVFKRDNYTCNICKKHSSTLPNGSLVAHHLDGYNWCKEKRTDVDNGVTLCEKCHDDFHSIYGNGDNTFQQFVQYVNSKK